MTVGAAAREPAEAPAAPQPSASTNNKTHTHKRKQQHTPQTANSTEKTKIIQEQKKERKKERKKENVQGTCTGTKHKTRKHAHTNTHKKSQLFVIFVCYLMDEKPVIASKCPCERNNK